MKYKEIFKLKEMLEEANIPFEWQEYWGYSEKELKELKKIAPDLIEHYQICYPSFGDDRWISVIQGFGTYGSEQDKLEIMGGFTEEESGGDSVMGYMTAVDVFNRIKNHFIGRGKFIMKKTIKTIDEDTLEIKETVVEDDITDEVDEKITQAFQNALNCDPEEFYKKYRKYKKAEKEFNDIYEPFKEKLIKLHEQNADLPKRAVIGDVQLIYVSPSTRTSIDSKKLKEEEPDIAKKYTKTTNVKATIRLEEML